MDALALLCTLHADGPTTLTRLRTAECTSLEHVIAHPTERVARWMRVNVATAERFQREARALYERIGSESAAATRGAKRDAWARDVEVEHEHALERGEPEPEREMAARGRGRSPADRVADALSRIPYGHRATDASRADFGAPDTTRGDLDAPPVLEHGEDVGDRDAVFDRERARALAFEEEGQKSADFSAKSPSEALDPRTRSGRAADVAANTRAEDAADGAAHDHDRRVRLPSGRDAMLQRVLDTWRVHDEEEQMTESDVDDVPAALPVPVTQLPAIPTHRIDGLDAECSLALAKVGVGTIEALAACDALAIARATSMPFARVLRLRALARRVHALSPEVGASSVTVSVPMTPRTSTASAASLMTLAPTDSDAQVDAQADAKGSTGWNSERASAGLGVEDGLRAGLRTGLPTGLPTGVRSELHSGPEARGSLPPLAEDPPKLSPADRPPEPNGVILPERDFILHPAPREEGAGGPFA